MIQCTCTCAHATFFRSADEVSRKYATFSVPIRNSELRLLELRLSESQPQIHFGITCLDACEEIRFGRQLGNGCQTKRVTIFEFEITPSENARVLFLKFELLVPACLQLAASHADAESLPSKKWVASFSDLIKLSCVFCKTAVSAVRAAVYACLSSSCVFSQAPNIRCVCVLVYVMLCFNENETS